METLWMVLGFAIAAYSVVANDSIQTLGTFLASNNRRPWWVLWLYAGGILTAVAVYGYLTTGDVSYGRLEKIPAPEHFSWIFVVPPLALLFLTRTGVPVSTTFLILTVFAPGALEKMLMKSAIGYAGAFVVGLVVYLAVAKVVEKRFLDTADQEPAPYWTALQWLSTGFLWSQWLIQDAANIFVYTPRPMTPGWLVFALGLMLAMQAYTFYTSGGEIQKIVTAKTNTQDIRSATIIDFIYALGLLFFKEWSHIPMSTTWVFLGLLAGRELGIVWQLGVRSTQDTMKMVFSDAGKAFVGLVVSIVLALGLPWLAAQLPGAAPVTPADQVAPAH